MNKSLKIKDSMAECIQEKLSHLPLSLRVLLLWHMLQLSQQRIAWTKESGDLPGADSRATLTITTVILWNEAPGCRVKDFILIGLLLSFLSQVDSCVVHVGFLPWLLPMLRQLGEKSHGK